MTDEIIRELWQVKDQIAKDFNYDIDRLAAEMRRRQKESGRKVVDLTKEAMAKVADATPTGLEEERAANG